MAQEPKKGPRHCASFLPKTKSNNIFPYCPSTDFAGIQRTGAVRNKKSLIVLHTLL